MACKADETSISSIGGHSTLPKDDGDVEVSVCSGVGILLEGVLFDAGNNDGRSVAAGQSCTDVSNEVAHPLLAKSGSSSSADKPSLRAKSRLVQLIRSIARWRRSAVFMLRLQLLQMLSSAFTVSPLRKHVQYPLPLRCIFPKIRHVNSCRYLTSHFRTLPGHADWR
jgi:hypothetical protein